MNLIRDYTDEVTGEHSLISVPGYSKVNRYNNTLNRVTYRYLFSPAVSDIVEKIKEIFPGLIKALSKMEALHSLRPSDFVELSHSRVDWCVKNYIKWLSLQPYMGIGGVLPSAECLTVPTVRKLQDFLAESSLFEVGRLGHDKYYVGPEYLTKPLYSPGKPKQLAYSL